MTLVPKSVLLWDLGRTARPWDPGLRFSIPLPRGTTACTGIPESNSTAQLVAASPSLQHLPQHSQLVLNREMQKMTETMYFLLKRE